MQFVVLAILVLLVVTVLRHALKNAKPALVLDLRKIAFYAFLVVLALLVISGRLAWVVALVSGLIAAAFRLMPLLAQVAPILARILRRPYAEQAGGDPRQPPSHSGKMSREDALQILGLQPGASREAVIEAHRRLIQKLHPDRGGSDYLASQINQARKLLLNE